MSKKIKIVAICGSPHRGNTYEILSMLEPTNSNIEFKILMLSELNLDNCRGCYSCINKGEVTCPLKDDRDIILEEMSSADGVIFASPTYARMISAEMKKFIERTSFIAHRPTFFGKYAVALTTYAGFGGEITCNYLKENFTQYGFHFVDSAEIMVSRKSRLKSKRNVRNATKAFKKLLKAIRSKTKVKPSFYQLVYFNIFKFISELNKVKGLADYEFYKDKKDFYYEVKIPFLKNRLAKWIAKKRMRKMLEDNNGKYIKHDYSYTIQAQNK